MAVSISPLLNLAFELAPKVLVNLGPALILDKRQAQHRLVKMLRRRQVAVVEEGDLGSD